MCSFYVCFTNLLIYLTSLMCLSNAIITQAWTSGINKCLADGNQPEYMSKNPTQYLFPDRQACCTKHYSWSLSTCLFDSPDLGNSQWYIDWTRQTGGACVMKTVPIVEDLQSHGILSGVARKNAAKR